MDRYLVRAVTVHRDFRALGYAKSKPAAIELLRQKRDALLEGKGYEVTLDQLLEVVDTQNGDQLVHWEELPVKYLWPSEAYAIFDDDAFGGYAPIPLFGKNFELAYVLKQVDPDFYYERLAEWQAENGVVIL